ncbi:MAG: ribonuclease HII [Sulfurovaceae bacterium]|nr:ribonuclease HII [Sulfurovaceae bacterium]MDD5548544.1 ribonuclease HII [Sulfurovaceae bacterium]
MQNKQQLCGIDEAGRGPLAGPLVMAGVVLMQSMEGLADSKKLSSKKREELFEKITKISKYHIVVINSKQIDDIGISACLAYGLKSIIENLSGFDYLFDGNCTFGVENLKTMIKADDKVHEVSAASILAKVTRDKIMEDYDISYPNYGFKSHKGYGTKSHIEAILKFGRCDIHRYSYRLKEIDY